MASASVSSHQHHSSGMIVSSSTAVGQVPSSASIALNTSRDSMVFTSTKGLLNGPGQNNCFLNSAVQVLWHLDIFRRSFRDLSGHACMAESCIFCALKELFSQLQFSHETALPPDALRRALAESFFDQQRFQLGFMDDAAECFENMLLRIHMHIAHGEAEDMCSARHCIPHQKFAMTLVEQSICGSCGATSEPLSFTQMVHYVSASALTTQVRQNMVNGRPAIDSFGELLRKAGSMGDIRDCPSQCGAKIQICRNLMNRPEIVSVGVVWDSERPTLEHIMDVFATIGTTLKLGDVFHSVVDNRWAELTTHSLVGVVTYYGKHYSTFFFHTKLRVWIYFDDATVREVGPRWEQVVEKCRRGRYQPLLLLYAVPNGSPVNTEHAPKVITPFYQEKNTPQQHNRNLPPLINGNARRSITPSPEKPLNNNNNNMRRAITPNPGLRVKDTYSEYQNLSVIQDNIYAAKREGIDCVDSGAGTGRNVNITVHRTLSNGSGSSGMEGINVPDHLNVPRRRDSGNWSGDRNSASSSSSTTMENPYLYLVGKLPHHHQNGGGGNSVPGSPTRSGNYDAGYDSYSLSSNDSSTMTTIQHLMKMGHLAKIPEDYNGGGSLPNANGVSSASCDVLCEEADELLSKSRQMEDNHDLVLALALCNAAATKARAAMNAPYNNPQTLTLARMKHNTCIMRARSLHRRMTQQNQPEKLNNAPEIRHTREGSSGGSGGRHSRQNSRDKSTSNSHSRQGSRELLNQSEKSTTKNNIEIYATLPKKKDALKKVNISIEDEEYMIYDDAIKSTTRESRSIFSRNKDKSNKDSNNKRSRSEDRNKMSRDFSIAPDFFTSNNNQLIDTSSNKSSANKDNKESKDKDKDKESGKGKKQHKIRRKLLMGGLIRRKNRSMPDLTEGGDNNQTLSTSTSSIHHSFNSVDDSNIGKGKNKKKDLNGSSSTSNMCGYLSEGHLEFSGTNSSTNPNLERSRLMRKSFHGNKVLNGGNGGVVVVPKVPPPPPLRTTSQLSKSKLNGAEVCSPQESDNLRSQYPLPNDEVEYGNAGYYNGYGQNYGQPQNQSQTIVIRADVHQEQSPLKNEYYGHNHNNGYNGNFQEDSGVDEVDTFPPIPPSTMLDLPPYPSPAASVVHSRQPSEEFPPPPPPLDLSALDEHLNPSTQPQPQPGSLLAELQNKRMQILTTNPQPQDINVDKLNSTIMPTTTRSSGETWLKELQAKQAALRAKKMQEEEATQNSSSHLKMGINDETAKSSSSTSTVKDLASRFESVKINTPISSEPRIGCSLMKKEEDEFIQNQPQQQQLHQHIQQNGNININNEDEINIGNGKPKLVKKKSVSFCDQVILVEEQEDDSYIPNPILERVLRTAMNKPETAAIRKEIMSLRGGESESEYGGEDVVDLPLPLPSSSVVDCGQRQIYGHVEGRDTDQVYSNQNRIYNNQEIQQQQQNWQAQNHMQIQNQNIQQNGQILNQNIQQNGQIQGLPSRVNHQNQGFVQHQQNGHNGGYHQSYTQTQNGQVYGQHQSYQNGVSPYQNQITQSNMDVYSGRSPHQQPMYVHRQNSMDNLLSSSPSPSYASRDERDFPAPSSQGNGGRYEYIQNQPQSLYGSSPHQRLGNFVQEGLQRNPVNFQNSMPQDQGQRAYPPVSQENVAYHQNRQSPYQRVPSPHQMYQHQTSNSGGATQTRGIQHQVNAEYSANYSSSPRNLMMNHQSGQVRQSPTPSNHSYYGSSNPGRPPPHPQQSYHQQRGDVYQRVPNPNLNYPYPNSNSNEVQELGGYNENVAATVGSPYQRVPLPHPHHHIEASGSGGGGVRSPYQHLPQSSPSYGSYHQTQGHISPKYPQNTSSPYQQVPQPKQQMPPPSSSVSSLKKVSFEPGTKGGCESPTPKAVVTPIIVNNNINNTNNNSSALLHSTNNINASKTKCNLCRKKHAQTPSLYCNDCEFYMSRFKPKS